MTLICRMTAAASRLADFRDAVASAELALGAEARSVPSAPAQDSISRESAELRVSIDAMMQDLEERAVDYAMVRRPLVAPGSREYTEADRNAIDARYAEFLVSTRRSIDALRAAASKEANADSFGIAAHHSAKAS